MKGFPGFFYWVYVVELCKYLTLYGYVFVGDRLFTE